MKSEMTFHPISLKGFDTISYPFYGISIIDVISDKILFLNKLSQINLAEVTHQLVHLKRNIVNDYRFLRRGESEQLRFIYKTYKDLFINDHIRVFCTLIHTISIFILYNPALIDDFLISLINERLVDSLISITKTKLIFIDMLVKKYSEVSILLGETISLMDPRMRLKVSMTENALMKAVINHSISMSKVKAKDGIFRSFYIYASNQEFGNTKLNSDNVQKLKKKLMHDDIYFQSEKLTLNKTLNGKMRFNDVMTNFMLKSKSSRETTYMSLQAPINNEFSRNKNNKNNVQIKAVNVHFNNSGSSTHHSTNSFSNYNIQNNQVNPELIPYSNNHKSISNGGGRNNLFDFNVSNKSTGNDQSSRPIKITNELLFDNNFELPNVGSKNLTSRKCTEPISSQILISNDFEAVSVKNNRKNSVTNSVHDYNLQKFNSSGHRGESTNFTNKSNCLEFVDFTATLPKSSRNLNFDDFDKFNSTSTNNIKKEYETKMYENDSSTHRAHFVLNSQTTISENSERRSSLASAFNDLPNENSIMNESFYPNFNDLNSTFASNSPNVSLSKTLSTKPTLESLDFSKFYKPVMDTKIQDIFNPSLVDSYLVGMIKEKGYVKLNKNSIERSVFEGLVNFDFKQKFEIKNKMIHLKFYNDFWADDKHYKKDYNNKLSIERINGNPSNIRVLLKNVNDSLELIKYKIHPKLYEPAISLSMDKPLFSQAHNRLKFELKISINKKCLNKTTSSRLDVEIYTNKDKPFAIFKSTLPDYKLNKQKYTISYQFDNFLSKDHLRIGLILDTKEENVIEFIKLKYQLKDFNHFVNSVKMTYLDSTQKTNDLKVEKRCLIEQDYYF